MNNKALEELDKAIHRAQVDHPALATYYYNRGKIDRLLFSRELIEIDHLRPLVDNANRSRHMAKAMNNPDKLPPYSKEYYQGKADGDAEALDIARKYM